MADFDPAAGRWPGLAALRAALDRRELTAADLLAGARARIAAVDPLVRAVLAADPSAVVAAADSDRRLAAGTGRPLEGVPVLVKDNIDTTGLATTAGSRLLAAAGPPDADAPLVELLRAAGAVLVGKTNLSEWGNFRRTGAVEGWSGTGGQTRNPYVLDRSPWGSSAGSAVAVAAGMVPLAIGTETDGSVVCPAAVCGVVGFKPRLGALPGRGIVPISAVQDTPGLLAVGVADVALAYAVLVGSDSAPRLPGPAGLRLGLWPGRRTDPTALAALDRAAVALRAAGVELVPVDLPFDREVFDAGLAALIAEFAPSLRGYLRARPGAPPDLAAVLAAIRADPAEAGVGQDLMELAAAVGPADRAAAPERRARARGWARHALDTVLAGADVAGIVAPTGPSAWPIDRDGGDPPVAATSTIPTLAGRPNISVPTGLIGALPVGVSVFGPPRTRTVLRLAAAVEAAVAVASGPLPAPRFLPTA